MQEAIKTKGTESASAKSLSLEHGRNSKSPMRLEMGDKGTV